MNLIDTVALSKKICDQPIQCQLAYTTANNFLGRIVNGYHQDAFDICLLTPKAAHALCQVQNELIHNHELGLLVFDAYRPRRAVKDFMQWSKAPPASDFELQRKKLHYPHIEKNQLFDLGYVAEDSNHCYGNTVDLVLIDLQTKKILNMGDIFDYMDPLSHITNTENEIGAEAYQNRQILRDAMEKHGFHPYQYEFWHYCHGGPKGREVEGPLDIEITANLKGIGV